MIPVTASNDAELVDASLAGNRDAFGQIVARYQSLVCSLAYSATGSLGQSEDLSQETFITAWKHLGHLRERHKLRSWLCGIARNRINNFLRREGREPIRAAEPLENASESHSPEPLPRDHTISNEEQAILWRSLERIPEIYREPLILFYREHQSVEAVAEKLELTEDAVKQRLSRGRKLLHEEVLAFVEGALEKTAPGKTFTLGVITALPLLATTAKAATVGTTAAKSGTALKILFMTKTTQAIIVAAVTVTAVLTTQTIVHHYRTPDSSGGRHGVQIKLTPAQSTEAQQAARGFLEALQNSDWQTVAKYWPPNVPPGKGVNDIFTDQNKKLVAGLEIVSLGTPYKEEPNSGIIFVPYEVRWKAGGTQKNSLRLGQGPDGQWIWDGGF